MAKYFGQWCDPELEIPENDECVLGIVSGEVAGAECERAAMLVSYDAKDDAWHPFHDPALSITPEAWCYLPDWPEEDDDG